MADALEILVIDASMAVRRMSQLALPQSQVASAPTGREGLAAARAAGFDLILVEDQPTDMSGEAVVRELSQDPVLGTVPLLILCRKAPADGKPPFAGAGRVLGHVVKPFTGPELAEAVGRVIAAAAAAAESQVSTADRLRRQLVAFLGEAFAQIGDAPVPAGRNLRDTVAEFLLSPGNVARFAKRLEGRASPPPAMILDADKRGVCAALRDLLLRRHGVELIEIDGAGDAVAQVVAARPCLVVTDADTCGLDPAAFAEAIRGRLGPSARLAVSSQSADPTREAGWRQAGFDIVLLKPYLIRELEPLAM